MEILNATLVSLGISSPLVIALSTAIFFLMKNLMESKFEVYKDVTIEKLKNQLEIRSLESQHLLSIEYDRIKNIHDNQKEKLTKILQELNSVISKILDSFVPQDNEFPCVESAMLLKVKRSIYSDGLYIDPVALELISSFFDLAERNSTAQYEYLDPGDEAYFNYFDFRLMELLQNEVFFRFRRQIGIDAERSQSSLAESALVLATLSGFRGQITDDKVSELFSDTQDILRTVTMITEDTELRAAILKEIGRLTTTRRAKFESPRAFARLLAFFSETSVDKS